MSKVQMPISKVIPFPSAIAMIRLDAAADRVVPAVVGLKMNWLASGRFTQEAVLLLKREGDVTLLFVNDI